MMSPHQRFYILRIMSSGSLSRLYDVIVVGAGPAGTTAAFLLAKAGVSVLIIEKNRFPRTKVCGGLITWKTAQVLRRLFDVRVATLRQSGVIHYHSHRYGVFNTTRQLVAGAARTPFYFVERNAYDAFWLDRAVSTGAEVLCGDRVVDMDDSGRAVTTRAGKQFRCRFILGADGVFSRVRQFLDRRRRVTGRFYDNLAVALEIFVPRSGGEQFPDHPVIYLGFNRWGYAWSFPGSGNQVLGMSMLKPKNRIRLKTAFCRFLETQPVSTEDLAQMQGFAMPYGNYLKKPGDKNILLLGDACGLADPLLGEGIYYAHKSGELAAEAVTVTLDTPAAGCGVYTSLASRSILVEMNYARLVRGIVFTMAKAFNYGLLGFLMKLVQNRVEETIQGQRSFKLMRRFTPDAANPAD